jgi:hypothetical protein
MKSLFRAHEAIIIPSKSKNIDISYDMNGRIKGQVDLLLPDEIPRKNGLVLRATLEIVFRV